MVGYGAVEAEVVAVAANADTVPADVVVPGDVGEVMVEATTVTVVVDVAPGPAGVVAAVVGTRGAPATAVWPWALSDHAISPAVATPATVSAAAPRTAQERHGSRSVG